MTRKVEKPLTPWEVAPNGRFAWTVRCQGMLLHTEPFQFLALWWAKKQCLLDYAQFGVGGEVSVKGKDGKVRFKNTYPRSMDPPESKG